jgi:hypothetical protein
MSKPCNIYNVYRLALHASDFGLSSTDADSTLKKLVSDTLLPSFNTTDFSIGKPGISFGSLKTLEMFSHYSKSNNYAENVVSSFLNKISSFTNGDKYSYFSTHIDEVGSAAFNTHVLRILAGTNKGLDSLSKEQKVGLRNFLVQQAVISGDVK